MHPEGVLQYTKTPKHQSTDSRRLPERLSFTDRTNAFVAGRRKAADTYLQYVAATNFYVLPERIHCLNERVALDHSFLAQRGVAKRETEFGHVASGWSVIPSDAHGVANTRRFAPGISFPSLALGVASTPVPHLS